MFVVSSALGNVFFAWRKAENDLEHHRNLSLEELHFGCRAFFEEFGRILVSIAAGRSTRGNKRHKNEWEVKRKSANSFLHENEVNFRIN